jgi:hypothetical protein
MLKASIFVKRVENRSDEATQKFRQLDGVKSHRPIPPPLAEPLPASDNEARLLIQMYADSILSYTKQNKWSYTLLFRIG